MGGDPHGDPSSRRTCLLHKLHRLNGGDVGDMEHPLETSLATQTNLVTDTLDLGFHRTGIAVGGEILGPLQPGMQQGFLLAMDGKHPIKAISGQLLVDMALLRLRYLSHAACRVSCEQLESHDMGEKLPPGIDRHPDFRVIAGQTRIQTVADIPTRLRSDSGDCLSGLLKTTDNRLPAGQRGIAVGHVEKPLVPDETGHGKAVDECLLGRLAAIPQVYVRVNHRRNRLGALAFR